MAELEANLLRAMKIPTDGATEQVESNKTGKVYQINRSGYKTITVLGAQNKSTSITRNDENNSSKNTTAAGTKR